MIVHGATAPGYENVREAFGIALAEDEGAAQLAVYRHGDLVVDLWTGEDRRGGTEWTGESTVVLMSVAKGITATCAHLLAQRGQLDIDAPVARYWPEFAEAGKESVTVRQLLAHSAGLLGFPPGSGITGQAFFDWEACVRSLASAELVWPPGTTFSYHSLTFGYLLGEVIRRIAGCSVGQFLQREIAGPLGLDLWIGLPESAEHRVAPTFVGDTNPPPALPEVDMSDPVTLAMLGGVMEAACIVEMINTRELHAAEVPAGNLIGNARSLARCYAAMLGEVDGVRLLSAEQMEIARTPQTDDLSAPSGLAQVAKQYPMRFGLGYELTRSGLPMLGPHCFGHTGAGGRLSYADPATGTAVGFSCTNMLLGHTDPRWVPWTDALREIVTG